MDGERVTPPWNILEKGSPSLPLALRKWLKLYLKTRLRYITFFGGWEGEREEKKGGRYIGGIIYFFIVLKWKYHLDKRVWRWFLLTFFPSSIGIWFPWRRSGCPKRTAGGPRWPRKRRQRGGVWRSVAGIKLIFMSSFTFFYDHIPPPLTTGRASSGGMMERERGREAERER